MKALIGIALYLCIGIVGRRLFGYKGLVETIIWPIGIPCAIYINHMKKHDDEVE